MTQSPCQSSGHTSVALYLDWWCRIRKHDIPFPHMSFPYWGGVRMQRKHFSVFHKKQFSVFNRTHRNTAKRMERRHFSVFQRKLFSVFTTTHRHAAIMMERKHFFCFPEKTFSVFTRRFLLFAKGLLYTKVITWTVSIFKGFKTDVSNLNQKNSFLHSGIWIISEK